MFKKWHYSLPLLFAGLFSCVESPEDFQGFNQRYYADSAFQLSRIVFPLTKKRFRDTTDPGSTSTIIVYNKEDWTFQPVENTDSAANKILIDQKDSITIKTVAAKDSDVLRSRLIYKRIKNKWYLVRIEEPAPGKTSTPKGG